MRKIIASLDLGSSYLKLVVGEIYKNKLNVLASTEKVSRGIKCGFIVNQESALESIKEIIKVTNEKIGYEIKSVVLNIPSYQTETFTTSAKINIKDGIVSQKNIADLLNLCVKDKINKSYKVICNSPIYYVVNDVDKTKKPLGMNASTLACKTVVNVVPMKNVEMLIECLKKIDIEVVDYLINPISDAYQFMNSSMLESNGAIINFGYEKIEVSIFNKGILTNSEVINSGSKLIEYDIAKYYKLAKEDAKYIKEKLIVFDKNMAKAEEFIVLENKGNENIRINQYDVSVMGIKRAIELLNLIKKQINLLTNKEISYIIVTGGITCASCFSYLLDEIFNHKAKIGTINELGIRDNKYSSCAGLIKYYNKKLKDYDKDFSILTIEEQEDFGGMHKKVHISGNSPLGKFFRYFFDS